MVSGQLKRPVLFEPEDPDTIHAATWVREPQLYNADNPQLSFARAMELDGLSWTARSGLHQKISIKRILKSECPSVKEVGLPTGDGIARYCNSTRPSIENL